MRISDWSSDVCSSDLDLSPMFASAHNGLEEMARQFQEFGEKSSKAMVDMVNNSLHALNELQNAISSGGILGILSAGRSEERRVGKECVSTCRSRWSQSH